MHFGLVQLKPQSLIYKGNKIIRKKSKPSVSLTFTGASFTEIKIEQNLTSDAVKDFFIPDMLLNTA